ncbi:cell envelope integrity protein CreD [Maricaulaceae bacterium MS644]
MDRTQTRSRALGLKIIMVGALVFLLGVPLFFVNLLAWERAGRADEVARSVGEAYGGRQTLRGPFLLLPVDVTETVSVERDGETVQEQRIRRETIIVSPETLDIGAALNVELRRRAIYEVPVYTADLTLDAVFATAGVETLTPRNGAIRWDQARLVAGVQDLRGMGSDIAFTFNGAPSPTRFEPGSPFDRQADGGRSGRTWRGVSAPLNGLEPGAAFTMQAAFTLSGAQSLGLVASGRETRATLAGDWPHPGFDGAYLPAERTIAETGFEAEWRVPYLARGIPARWLEGSGYAMATADETAFIVNLTSPTDGYVRVSRSLKYAFFFVGFTLLMVFLIEATGAMRVHAAQYVLIGLAQVIFYLMMLALSEHAALMTAYAGGSGATILVTALYAGAAFRSAARGLLVFAALVMTYALQYLLILMEDYALLIGAGLAFAAVSVTMLVTRHVDWYGLSTPESEPGSPAPAGPRP